MIRRGLVAAAAVMTAGTAQAAWQQGSSKHFVVYADDTPEHVKTFTERLERFDKAVRAWHQAPEDRRGASARVTVFVVSDLDAIRKLSGSQMIAGFYIPRAGESVAFVPHRSGAGADYGLTSQAVLFHEYTHHWMLTNWSDAALPPWYVEGAAEMHATAQFRSDGSVVFGAPPVYRQWTVGKTNLLPAAQLTRFNPGKLNNEERDALYSRGWLLTHYLTFDPERRKLLAAYVGAVNSGKPSDEASAILGDMRTLDLKLNSYAQALHFASSTVAAKDLAIDPVQVRALTPGEAAVMPALITSRRGVDKTSAPKVLDVARAEAAAFPTDAAAQNELAEAEYDACNVDPKVAPACFGRAGAAADRALAADSRSVHALIYKGLATERAAVAGKTSDPATWTEARHWFLLANKADTEAPQPLVEFYRSFLVAHQKPTANAESGLLYAYALAPYDPDLRLLATRVLLDQGKAAQARTALAPVAFNTDDPGTSGNAQKVLAALDKDGSAAALAELDKQAADAEKEGPKES